MAVAQYTVPIVGRVNGPAQNTWTFIQGSIPGGTFNTASVDAVMLELDRFYDDLAPSAPDDLTWEFPAEAKVYDEGDGELLAFAVGSSAPTSVAGRDTATRTAIATHAKIQTRSGVVSDGRELRGGIFFGPLADQAMDLDGTITTAFQADVQAAGVTLITNLTTAGVLPVVWRRPRPGSSPLGARSGSLALITNIAVWGQAAVLRSRRD